MTTSRYGTLGPGPVDRDAERLAHEIFVERQQVFPEHPHQISDLLREAGHRLRLAVAVLRHGGTVPRAS